MDRAMWTIMVAQRGQRRLRPKAVGRNRFRLVGAAKERSSSASTITPSTSSTSSASTTGTVVVTPSSGTFRQQIIITSTNRFNSLQERYFSGTTTNNNNNNNHTAEPPRSRNKHAPKQTQQQKQKQQHRTSVSDLEQDTQRLLQTPSNWSLKDWRASENALASWTYRQSTKQPPTKQSIHWSFRLLRRMAHEAQQQQQQNQNQNQTFVLTNKHVNGVLDRWRIGTRIRGLLDPKRWSASKVLEIVEDYAEQVPSLHLDTKSYSLIMAGHITQYPTRSSPFCTEIVQRMMNTPTAPPNAVALTYLMDAHVHAVAAGVRKGQQGQSNNNAVFATQSLFDYLVEKSQDGDGDPSMAPTEKSLTRVLQAWVSLSSPTTTTIQEVLAHMKRNIQCLIDAPPQGNRKALPNALFLDLVLQDCSKRMSSNNAMEDHSILLADALVTHVVELSIDHPHLLPEAKTLSRMIFLWTKNDGMVVQDAAAPRRRAEYWLDEMCRLWKQVPNYDSPRYTVYGAVIAAWGRQYSDHQSSQGRGLALPEAAWHAERIWHRMIEDTSVATIGGAQTVISLWDQVGEPARAEQILRELIVASENDPALLPPTSTYVEVMQAWQQEQKQHKEYQARESAANHAHAILELLLEQKRLHPDRYNNNDNDGNTDLRLLELAEIPFQICLNIWVQSGLPNNEAEAKVDTILESMNEQGISLSYTTLGAAIPCFSALKATELLTTLVLQEQPLLASKSNDKIEREKVFEQVLQLWSTSSDPGAGKHAEQLLHQYLALSKNDGNGERTLACFDHVVRAWKYSTSPDESLENIEALLDRISDIAKDAFTTTGNPSLYAKLAETWARSGLPGSTEQTQKYFGESVEQYCHLHGNEIPSSWFENVIAAFVDCGNVSEAEAYMQQARKDNLTLTSKMYVPLIKGLVGQPSGLAKATTLLEEMVSCFVVGKNEEVKPNANLFGLLIGAHAQHRNTEQVQFVWGLLQRLQRHDPTDDSFQADSRASSGLASAGDHVGRDVFLLQHMLGEPMLQNCGITLDEGTIQCVMEALAKSGDPKSGRRAEGILLKMQELYEEGVLEMEPTFGTFQKVIDSWVNSTEEGSAARANDVLLLAERLSREGKEKLLPDSQGYVSVIAAWSKSHDLDAPERILELVGKMKQRYDQGDRQFSLNGAVYAALIEAYSNSDNPEAAKLAKGVFDAAPEKFQDTELYNALIGAQGGDAISAEAILQEMHQRYLDGNEKVQPNTESFNQILWAWSRSGSPMAAWRVDGIFNRMNELHSSGQLPVQPNARTFDMVIWTLANALGADGALKVERYLELLKEYYRAGHPDCMPSATSYTEAIRVWGSNVDDPRSVLRAKALLDEMHELAREGIKGVQPDRNTYSVYLQALARSSADRKAEIAKDVATMMKSDGIRPEGHLLEHLQRCLLPSTAVLSGWTVLLDEQDTNDEGFINL